jgi:hypothetical protein
MTEPNINRELPPHEARVDKLITLVQQLTQVIMQLEQTTIKHEKAIGVLLKEVKDLRDKQNKPTIYKP